MRVMIAGIALGALLATGCAHVPAPRTLGETSQFTNGKNGTVVFVAGPAAAAKDLRVSETTVSWTDPHAGIRESTEACAVAEIRIPRRGRGALRGLGIGCLTGGLIGVVGVVSGGVGCASELGQGGCAVIGGAMLGAVGGGGGTLLGILLDEDVYAISTLAKPPPADIEASPER